MLETRASISDAPRSGRPPLYTKGLMRRAVQILVENEDELLTGTMLLEIMIRLGLVGQHADVDTFMSHLRTYVRAIGHKFVVNSTSTIFMLTADDVVKRVQFAVGEQEKLEGQSLDMAIFVDETTLEETPHPKGKLVCSSRGSCLGITPCGDMVQLCPHNMAGMSKRLVKPHACWCRHGVTT
jgi:hypothetical protein